MNSERSRLRTFQNWPANAPVDCERIAKAGFYYMGQDMEVQCFSCGGRISEWQYGDMVMAKHRLLDPRCRFVVNPTESGNVPISETSNEPVVGGTSRVIYGTAIDATTDMNKYKDEAFRKKTFVTWPIPTKVDGFRLAAAGFYYLQELDKVRCAFCGIDAYNWETGDDPVVEHRRHSPSCPFLCNLPVERSSCSSNAVFTVREEYFNFDREQELEASRMKDFGILNHRIPKHSKYITEELRILSFGSKWPKSEIKDPSLLAAAGFYYTGVNDQVRCYHCGGGLQKWKQGDDPWIEHAKWFPTCDFLFLVQGAEFVKEVQKNVWDYLQFEGQKESSTPTSEATQSSDEQIIQSLMTSPPVLSTLHLGLDVSRIKQVLRIQLQRNRKTSLSKDELIAAVLDTQFNESIAELTDDTGTDHFAHEVRQIFQASSRLPGVRPILNNSTNQNYSSSNEDHVHQRLDEDEDEDDQTQEYMVENDSHQTEAPETATNIPTLADNGNDSEEMLVVECVDPAKKPETNCFNSDCGGSETWSPKPSSTVGLEEENRKLKEAKLCKICMDQDVNIVFLPCGHLVTCSICAANIPDCPVCRQMIKGTVRTYLA